MILYFSSLGSNNYTVDDKIVSHSRDDINILENEDTYISSLDVFTTNDII